MNFLGGNEKELWSQLVMLLWCRHSKLSTRSALANTVSATESKRENYWEVVLIRK